MEIGWSMSDLIVDGFDRLLCVKKCKWGRGVFATSNYEPNELIEICPVIVLDDPDKNHFNGFADKTIERYIFGFGKNKVAIALGYGSLYNHSTKPNAAYGYDVKTQEIHFWSITDIKKGEQILIDYGYNPKELLKKQKKKRK